jgi:hypothetical protein
MEVTGQLHAPTALSSDIHWLGCWVGSRAGLVVVMDRKYPRRPTRSLVTILIDLPWLTTLTEAFKYLFILRLFNYPISAAEVLS